METRYRLLSALFSALLTAYSLAAGDQGQTDSSTLIWSGDTLMDPSRYQALRMTLIETSATGKPKR